MLLVLKNKTDIVLLLCEYSMLHMQSLACSASSLWRAQHLWSVYKKKLRGFSPPANYTDQPSDRRLSAKLVPTLADRGCRVVNATNPHGR
jgi:hypothetical protein